MMPVAAQLRWNAAYMVADAMGQLRRFGGSPHTLQRVAKLRRNAGRFFACAREVESGADAWEAVHRHGCWQNAICLSVPNH